MNGKRKRVPGRKVAKLQLKVDFMGWYNDI